MRKQKHIAIYGNDLTLSNPIIKQIINGKSVEYLPELKGKKGELFSNISLAKFIDEEFLHENYNLSGDTKRSIRTFSSGEQKKALLQYLLSKNPDFLIIDNPFDSLDAKSVDILQSEIIALANKIPILQLFKRRNDLLPFISHAMVIDNNCIVYFNTIDDFFKSYFKTEPLYFSGTIPQPIDYYEVSSKELVCFTDVDVSYEERKILNKINWTIKAGEFWQLKGPNGSGKSTMLTMINGDNPKAFGQNLTLFGKCKGSGENVWQIKKLIGYFTPSMMELFKHRHTAKQMVISGLVDSIGLYRKATDMQVHLADKWLKLIGVYEKKDRPFLELSQVQQRMVLIARAMIKHPPLLILDEPSIGLDDHSASLLSVLINKMADESSTAILYVSHRKEPELKPQFTYELKPGDNGSIGKIV